MQLSHQPAPKPTIDSLDPWPSPKSVAELTPEGLIGAFTGLSVGQQQNDLWAVYSTRYGDPLGDAYDFWLMEKGITMDSIREWNHGPEVATVRKLKTSGAQTATRIIKRLRLWEADATALGRGGLIRALMLMELEYTMLIYATNRHVVDAMIPDHNERLSYLKHNISQTKARATMQPAVAAEGESTGPSAAGWEEVVAGFKQELHPEDVPVIIRHRHERLVTVLEDLLTIPTELQHLMKPRSQLGFQRILLFGPPGTRKTLLAQTVAAKSGWTFFKVPADQLTSKWVGETAKIMQTLFSVARANSPAVIFFDEVDYLTRTRTGEESGFERRSKNQLLKLFSKLYRDTSVLLMGATNRPWDIDSAIISRFHQRVFVGLPNTMEKEQMLVTALEEGRCALTDADYKGLAQAIEDIPYSGRDIDSTLGILRFSKLRGLKHSSVFASVENCLWAPCSLSHPHAKQQAFEEWRVEDLVPGEITYEDARVARSNVRPSVTKGELEQHEKWADDFGSDLDLSGDSEAVLK